MSKKSDPAVGSSDGIVVLRPYQEDISKRITAALDSKSRLLISLAAGFGRQITIAITLNELLEKRKINRALIVASRCEIQDQFFYCLNKYSSNYAHISTLNKRTKSDLRKDSCQEILISTLAMFRKINEPTPGLFDIIILDDCHQLSERDWFITNSLDSTIIGFTPLHPLEMSKKLLYRFGKRTPDYSYGMSSVKLRQLAEIRFGTSYTTSQLLEKGVWRFFRPRDIKSGKLEVTTFVSNDVAEKNQRSALKEGDILLQNIFSFGKMAIVTEKNLPAIASQNLFIIRSKVLAPEVLFEYLQSKTIADAFCKYLENVAHGAPIRHISLRDVGEIPVPLPFSEELLTEFAEASQLQDIEKLKKTKSELEQMMRAYLDFSGRAE